MNPVYLLLRIANILIFNYWLTFVFVVWALISNNYTIDEFLEKLLLIAGFITILVTAYYRFFSANRERDFSHVRTRVNSVYVYMGTSGAVFAAIYFDLGLYLDVANIVNGVGIKLYFLTYELGIGAGLGAMLLPDLFSYLEKIDYD